MNNSFKDQFSAFSQPREKVLENKIDRGIQKALDDAKYDYDYLKSEILSYAKNHGHIAYDGKKIITYLYSPRTHTRYNKDTGVRYKTGLFGGSRIIQTNIISVKPFPEDNWNAYYNEIIRLGKEDSIEIQSVIYNTIFKKVLCGYPITIQCKSGDFACIEIKLQCKIEF